MAGCWQFHLFGRVRVLRSPEASPLHFSPRSESLLAYLLLSRDRRVSRQSVIEAFWNDQPEQRARRSLATALWRLRRSLDGVGEDIRAGAGRAEVSLNGGVSLGSAGETCAREGRAPAFPMRVSDTSIRIDGDCWVDVTHFERTARSVLPVPVDRATPHLVRALQEAVALYRGDLLEGLSDEWAVRERERYQLLLQDCLAYLMSHAARSGACEEALGYGARLLQQDGLREDIHREMMRLYARSGRRALAIRQYEVCRETLAVELGITPMDETQRILDWVTRSTDEEPAASGAPSFEDLAVMLRTALEAQRALQVVIDELSRQTAGVASPAAASPPPSQTTAPTADAIEWPQHATVRPMRGSMRGRAS